MHLTKSKSDVALKRNGSLKRIRLGKQGQTAAAMVTRHRICHHSAMVVQLTCNEQVGGSSPSGGFSLCLQTVTRR